MPDSSAPLPPMRSWPAVAINCFVWMVACVVVATGIHHFLPFPKVQDIHEKYEYFAAHRDRYDVLFFGSSRILHQIVPARFDAVVRAAGGPSVRSFNFGAEAMWPPESFYVIRRVLALRPPNLRWVIVEMMDVKPGGDRWNALTWRRSYWHDWHHTRMAWADIYHSPFVRSKKARLFFEHGMHFIKTSLNFGRGGEWLEPRLGRIKPQPTPQPWVERQGFDPLPHKTMPPAESARYSNLLSGRREKTEPEPLPLVFRDALAELITEIRASAAEPIFLVTPSVRHDENYVDVPGNAPLVAFNDPDAYPDLFDPVYRFDYAHLDEQGAKLLTDLVAQRLAQQMRSRK